METVLDPQHIPGGITSGVEHRSKANDGNVPVRPMQITQHVNGGVVA